ncbi:CHASE2 domain-containing protein [Methylobacterium sp. W2]|uniref:CHASE2 domain-containing protein n=1 Tax=Methylobacterium sp. W2 TaxID=2598107 RepID=UPI001D0C47FA|nr:adenylate/guanylate cyclase domain-containing protein [Methylobacterium sp. W2]MCC0808214.1 CHASE2 domain-containing protein [Methylobacterium sp. W2]
MPRRVPPHLVLALAAMAVCCGWSLFLVRPHLRGDAAFYDRIESLLTDMRFPLVGPKPAPDDVVVIAIDDATIAAAGAYPVPRTYLAKLLRTLAAKAPKVIAVDVLFLDPGKPDSDADLADALASSPTIIGMAASFPRGGREARARQGPVENIPVAQTILRPVMELRSATRLGLVNVSIDAGGTPRHIPLLIAEDNTLQPALSLRTVSLATGSQPILTADSVILGARETPIDIGAGLALRFYGPQGTIRTVSASRVLDGNGGENFDGKVLFVGSTALASGDTLGTPFDPVFPGVELLATAASHLMHSDALKRTSTVRLADAATAVILPILMVMALSIRRVALGIALASLLLGAFIVVTIVSFAHGIWLAMALPLVAVAFPLAPFLAARLWLDRRSERRLTAARDGLLRFHPPAVAAKLSIQPDFLMNPVEQRSAILFIDLSGFTGMSERFGPRRTRALLKEMHDLVEDTATRRDGSVTTFMGDGAMILFGLPEARPDDSGRAVETAFALLTDLEGWIARLSAETGAVTGLRIGGHVGPVVISRLGGSHNQHITATGDTVNVASRLMDVAKAEGVAVVLSRELVAGLDPPEAGRAKRVILRGRREPIDVLCLRPLSSREG